MPLRAAEVLAGEGVSVEVVDLRSLRPLDEDAISKAVEGSRYGYYLFAARDDEDAASAAGVNPSLARTGAMGLSAFLTGIGGSLDDAAVASVAADMADKSGLFKSMPMLVPQILALAKKCGLG